VPPKREAIIFRGILGVHIRSAIPIFAGFGNRHSYRKAASKLSIAETRWPDMKNPTGVGPKAFYFWNRNNPSKRGFVALFFHSTGGASLTDTKAS
jgi:hypothetical protein